MIKVNGVVIEPTIFPDSTSPLLIGDSHHRGTEIDYERTR